MRIYEGRQATINKIKINGNDRLYENVVRRELRTRPGQLFSRDDLMRSMREIRKWDISTRKISNRIFNRTR